MTTQEEVQQNDTMTDEKLQSDSDSENAMKDEEISTDSTEKTDQAEEKEEDICSDRGLLKKIIKKGEGWKTPSKGSEVYVHYVGKLLDGTVFDSSRERNEQFTFKLGEGQVIKGWDKGVAEMKKGEIALLTCKPEYAYGTNGMPPKIPPNATLQFEVELLGWTEEKDVSVNHDGGVMKKTLTEGEGWENPKDDVRVKVNYVLKLSNGSVVEEKKDFEFITGAEEVPAGLDQAVTNMKKGEKALVTVKPEYAFGKEGRKDVQIPPNEIVQYEVELLEFDKEKGSWEMNAQEKFEVAQKKKEEGNQLFSKNKYRRAIKKYEKATQLFEYEEGLKDTEKETAKKLKLTCHLNTAACHLKMTNYKEALDACNKALKIEGSNMKALYRRGIANMEMLEFEYAKNDFERALDVEPNNPEVKKEMLKLKRKIQEQDKKDKKFYGSIFEKLVKIDEHKAKKKVNEQKENVSNGSSTDHQPMEVETSAVPSESN